MTDHQNAPRIISYFKLTHYRIASTPSTQPETSALSQPNSARASAPRFPQRSQQRQPEMGEPIKGTCVKASVASGCRPPFPP